MVVQGCVLLKLEKEVHNIPKRCRSCVNILIGTVAAREAHVECDLIIE